MGQWQVAGQGERVQRLRGTGPFQKTPPPHFDANTPRWPGQLFSWTKVEPGAFRVNKVRDDAEIAAECSSKDEHALLATFVDRISSPRKSTLSSVSTIVDVHSRDGDPYSHPYDQMPLRRRR